MPNTQIGLFALLAFTAFLAFLQGCSAPSFCGDESKREEVSPDQKRIATVFVRACGATTGWGTHVAMRWQSSLPADDDLVFTVAGKRDVQIKWLDDVTLSVSCEECPEDQVYRRVTKLGEVTVRLNE